jgi:hypothetical protein
MRKPQILVQLAASMRIGIDVAVDRLVANRCPSLNAEAARYLLGRPLPDKQLVNCSFNFFRHFPWLGPPLLTLGGFALRLLRPIAAQTSIAPNLSTHRGPVKSELGSDF